MKVEILWQGNPISCMKTFKKVGCKLCMMERVHILKTEKVDEKNLINTNEELFGACRHNAHFHRFIEKQIFEPSTDEARKAKKGSQNGPNDKAVSWDKIPWLPSGNHELVIWSTMTKILAKLIKKGNAACHLLSFGKEEAITFSWEG